MDGDIFHSSSPLNDQCNPLCEYYNPKCIESWRNELDHRSTGMWDELEPVSLPNYNVYNKKSILIICLTV